MSEKKRKAYYFLFKVLSILISCAFPMWAIYEKFQLWRITYSNTRNFGVGTILAIIVLAIIFRTTVFNFIRDKLKITHAPPLVVWLIFLAISYVLVFIGQFMGDVVVVFWMGLIGCTIGTVLTLIAEYKFGKKEDNDGQS
jgi:uncharacterized membrane protein